MVNQIKKIVAVGALAALALAGCSNGSSTSSSSSSSSSAPADGQKIKVVASFYPLAYLTERIGAEAVEVQNLTPSGEAHDVELSAKDTTDISKADAVVYLSGFQSSVDDAVKQAKPSNLLDVASSVDLVKAEQHESDADHEGDHDHEGEEAHDHGEYDPHFWLDPERYEKAIDPIVDTLSKANSAQADTFKANAKALKKEIEELDKKYASSLKNCQTPTVIAAHEAYGYMAERYGFKQVGVRGIDPEAETSIGRLEEVAKVAKNNKVSVLFSESALNDKDTKTLADQLGIQAKVLDPIEVQVDKNKDYLQVMNDNLGELKEAMKCS